AARAEPMVQHLLVEQVVALLACALVQVELRLRREGPDGAELGADRAVALQGLVGVDLDGVGDGAAMAASGVALRSHDVLLKAVIPSVARDLSCCLKGPSLRSG